MNVQLAAVPRRALMAAMALAATSILPAAAATEPESEAELTFVGCEQVNGSYFTWSPSEHTSRDAAYADWISGGGPVSVTWSATSPLDIFGFAPVYPPGSYEESGYATGDAFFVLLSSEGTVVYEAPFGVIRPDDDVPYFALRAHLDCSSVPYRSVPMPDTAMPAPDARLLVGTLMLYSAVAVGLPRLALRQRRR